MFIIVPALRLRHYEMWTGRKPNVSHLKVFGCLAHVLMQGRKKTKLEDKVCL